MINIKDGRNDLIQAVTNAISLRGSVCEIQKDGCYGRFERFIQKNVLVSQREYVPEATRIVEQSDVVLSCMNCYVWHAENRDDAIAEGIIVR
jgi:hypothetical protein